MPLCAVEGDPNTHEAGNLIAENPRTVYINYIPVIDHAPDPAEPDGHCPGDHHCNPETAQGSPNVFYYFNPVHRHDDLRICEATTVVVLQSDVFANDPSFDSYTFQPPTVPLVNFVPRVTPPTQLISKPDTPPAADQPVYTPPPAGQAPTPSQNAEIGVKPNAPGDFPQDGGVQDQPVTACEGDKPTVVPFLTKCLEESKKGSWRETGQGGKPSNPNIIDMWKNIGFNFNSDQTPWCAGFACFAMKQSGLKWIREAGARNLVNKLPGLDPGYKDVTGQTLKPGDIVLWSIGHVNFVYTANNGKYTYVGGNQRPGKNADPPIRDPNNDGDVTISYPSGHDGRSGIARVIRLDC